MPRNRKYLIAAAIGVLTFSSQAQVPQVRIWAAACANCHGTEGRAQPGMEALAGKDKADLAQKMLDFKNGRKPATIMHQISKGYSDEQIQELAAYFAAQKK